MKYKVCTKCNTLKPLTEFGKHSITKDGLSHDCKACIKKRSKRYYENNKERCDANSKIWTENNKEKVKNIKRQHYERNRELILDRVKKWQQDNKDRTYVNTKNSRERHKDHYKARNAVSCAVRKGDFPNVKNILCANCKTKKAVHYHHYLGYSKNHYLDVIPLCQDCHKH